MFKAFIKVASEASIELPALEVTVLLVLMSICLATKHQRVGLVATYIFAYRWGWTIFVGQDISFLAGYLVFGVLTGILTVVGLMTEKHD